MWTRIWKGLSNSGVNDQLLPSESRYVVLVNRFGIISGLVTLFCLLLLLIELPERGFSTTRLFLLVSGLLLIGITLINRFRYYNLAKWVVSWFPVFIIMTLSISDKLIYPNHITIKDFFSYRFFLFASTLIPLLIFSTRQIGLILISIIPSFICLVFFDFIHRPFGISFHQFGYDEPNFFILDVMIASASLTVIGFLLNQRKISDKFESALHEKQELLEEKNKELSHMNAFINEQNAEMNAQSEKLVKSHNALLQASRTIEKQKKLLEEQNLALEVQVKEKTKDLSMINEELLIRNNELRQFSHTLSHSLKSPVATFQGLLNLVDTNDLNDANKELHRYLNDSVNKMQEVFTDMNQMLEIRNKLYSSIEEVNLQKMIDELHNHFYLELNSNNIDFRYNFNGCTTIKTNEKQLASILYQLISNAIKFRAETRKPEINIQLNGNGSYHNLIVRDNGLGIDMQKYSGKLFFPYQQFHRQGCGKGLGLYLVKLHTESLGGNVRLSSEPDKFTKVEVKIRK
jgi:signal transduction histidine kinase